MTAEKLLHLYQHAENLHQIVHLLNDELFTARRDALMPSEASKSIERRLTDIRFDIEDARMTIDRIRLEIILEEWQGEPRLLLHRGPTVSTDLYKAEVTLEFPYSWKEGDYWKQDVNIATISST